MPGSPLAAAIVGSCGASFCANVPTVVTAISTGGCAGAGPSNGFSGWKRTSPALTTEMPLTRSRTGGRPGRAVKDTMSPG